jgi:hypothetical protein
MIDQHGPDVQHLPSHAQLWKATVIAAIIAVLLLTTVVLPAEYGIDPTRVGGILGLTKMSATAEQSAATDPAASTPQPNAAVNPRDVPFRTDTMSVTLQPGKGSELKATMAAGDRFVFTWATDGGPVNVDLHGEPPNAGNDFTSHLKGSQQQSGNGSFVAPFAGTHGWWWGNKTDKPVTVTVKIAGFYEKFAKP